MTAPTVCSLRSGALLDVTQLTVADITLLDLVWPLAHQCRYNGHCGGYYSVAEHCVYVARYLEGKGYSSTVVRMGLLHDAAEAWLGDLVRPLKATHPYYALWEEHIMAQVCAWAHLPRLTDRAMWNPVWHADDGLLRWELDHWWPGRADTVTPPLPDLGLRRPLHYWTPLQAATEFLQLLDMCWPPRARPDTYEEQWRAVARAFRP